VLEFIGPHAFYATGLTTITVPSTVKLIRKVAFKQCGRLATVTFPSNSVLESIGYESFAFSGLTAITVPSTVELIKKLSNFVKG
jgi:hypothetical protein